MVDSNEHKRLEVVVNLNFQDLVDVDPGNAAGWRSFKR